MYLLSYQVASCCFGRLAELAGRIDFKGNLLFIFPAHSPVRTSRYELEGYGLPAARDSESYNCVNGTLWCSKAKVMVVERAGMNDTGHNRRHGACLGVTVLPFPFISLSLLR